MRNLRSGAGTRALRWPLTAGTFVLLGGVLIGSSMHIEPHRDQRALDVAGYLMIVATSLSVALSWRWPRTATAVVTIVLCAFILRDYPDGPVWVTGWVSLGVLGWCGSRRSALAGGLAMTAALTTSALLVGQGNPVIPIVFLGWAAAAVLLGEALRNRRVYLAGLAERTRFAERSRADEAARRVAELRLRIAQDLHDTVAHAIVTINIQAAAASHVATKEPTASAEALANIQRVSAEVIDELASMLALLRDESSGTPELAPTPTATDIAALVTSVATTGLHVDLRNEGPFDRLPPALSTTAYRVVQECLTNSLKHSRADVVMVELTADPGAGRVTLHVEDPGPARAESDTDPVTGVGLRGMQERVSMTGGALTTGFVPEGAFVVRATWEGVPFS